MHYGHVQQVKPVTASSRSACVWHVHSMTERSRTSRGNIKFVGGLFTKLHASMTWKCEITVNKTVFEHFHKFPHEFPLISTNVVWKNPTETQKNVCGNAPSRLALLKRLTPGMPHFHNPLYGNCADIVLGPLVANGYRQSSNNFMCRVVAFLRLKTKTDDEKTLHHVLQLQFFSCTRVTFSKSSRSQLVAGVLSAIVHSGLAWWTTVAIDHKRLNCHVHVFDMCTLWQSV